MLIFLKGLIIGFAIAAPVGPIGILCIQRSLHQGFKIGLMTGFGAALADGCYGLIAGFGLVTISSFLVNHKTIIQFIGGLFLLYLGIKIIITHTRQDKTIKNNENSSWHALFTTFLLTLSNPITILLFIAVFAGLGLGTTHVSHWHAILLVLGITLGAGLWWLLLSGGVAFILRHKLSASIMRMINTFSGIIIIAFGIVSIATALLVI